MKHKHLLIISGRDTSLKYISHLPIKITMVQTFSRVTSFQKSLCSNMILVDDIKQSEREILLELRKIHEIDQFDAVISFLEFYLEFATKISRDLNILGNNIESVQICNDKYLMRQKLDQLGIPNIKYQKVTTIEDIVKFCKNNKYPCILKPKNGYGSIGVYKINSSNDLEKAFVWSKHSSDELIIEEFIEGDEYSIEGWMNEKGNHEILAITKKITSSEPYFIELGHTQPTNLSFIIENKIRNYTNKFYKGINNKIGPTHTEIKVLENNDVRFIEAHTRYGGDRIWELLLVTQGISIQNLVISSLFSFDITKYNPIAKYATILFLFSDKERNIVIEKTNEIISEPNLIAYELPKYTEVSKLEKSDDRFGYVICKGETEAKSLENAMKILRRIENSTREV